MSDLAPLTDLMERVRAILPTDQAVYLVGGAVRDALLGRSTHDLDFALAGDALAVGRRVAKALKAAYYPLDEEHGTARVILNDLDGERVVLDFAALRGPDLESDLRTRDFTINAMAIDLREPQRLLDPLDGMADLHSSLVRACSETTFQDDPLRTLRAVRQAAEYGFHILPDTQRSLKAAVALLPRVSPDRIRDELFRMLDGRRPVGAVRALDMLGLLEMVLPEMHDLKGVQQSPPHVQDVWSHTLAVMENLSTLLDVLSTDGRGAAANNWRLGLVLLRLGRYRQPLDVHLRAGLNPHRSLRSLLLMASLYHDAGKPRTLSLQNGGRIRFFDHEKQSAEMVRERARSLRLSNEEIERLERIVQNHMRPLLLARAEELPTRRAIYRFFRACGLAGVDVCLLSLADVLGTYGAGLPEDVWTHHMDVIRMLLEGWWEKPSEVISPPPLINGNELMAALSLRPGPQIGRILEAVREAQVEGKVNDRETALKLAQEIQHQV